MAPTNEVPSTDNRPKLGDRVRVNKNATMWRVGISDPSAYQGATGVVVDEAPARGYEVVVLIEDRKCASFLRRELDILG
jgi:ribosomal protein L21E